MENMPPTPPENVPPAYPTPEPPPMPTPEVMPPAPMPAKSNNRTIWTVVIVLLAVLLCCCIVVAVLFYLGAQGIINFDWQKYIQTSALFVGRPI